MRMSSLQLKRLIESEVKSIMESKRRTKRRPMREASFRPSLVSLIFEELSDAEAENLISKNITQPLSSTASKSTVEKIVQFLNSSEGQDQKVRDKLAAGASDGNPSDEVISVGQITLPVKDLKPSQSQIGLPNSIGFAFTSKGKEVGALDAAMKGDVNSLEIVACGDGAKNNFIIDGHHRWSSAIAVNPEAKITVSFIKGDDPFKVLSICQIAIATYKDGTLPSSTSEPETNLLTMTADAIAKYAKDNVGKIVDPKAGAALLTDDILDYLAEKGYGGASKADDRDTKLDKICTKIGENCAEVPKSGDAPERASMPQFDPKAGGPKLDQVKDKFTGGQLNFKDPVGPSGGGKEKSQVTADSWNRQGAVVVERWQRLAGLIK